MYINKVGKSAFVTNDLKESIVIIVTKKYVSVNAIVYEFGTTKLQNKLRLFVNNDDEYNQLVELIEDMKNVF